MIKVGIIGCGKVADQHATSIQRIAGCEIVGVCDREELMAKQMYERFEVKFYFDDVHKLLERARPDVVHITTPPQSHFELGKVCLEAGCNVYIEKPFTLNTEEAEKLIQLAEVKKLKLTVGHNGQFSHVAMQMRHLVKNGFLGGLPVHMESIHCYNFGNEASAKALLGDGKHWVRSLPGKLLHNIISHGIGRIAEFFTNDCPRVIAHGFTSPFLKSIDESDIIDELRVIIYDNDNTTAYFTFSSQISPALQQFRVYGPENYLVVDYVHQMLIKGNRKGYKSYLNHFIPPLIFAKQYLANSRNNMKKFIKRDFHNDAGMKSLIEAFYRSIIDGAPLPIPYREILITSRIMDEIFAQINTKNKMFYQNIPTESIR